MKKLVLLVTLVVLGMGVPVAVAAAEVSANDVSVAILKDWASEKYGCKIDKDGDLCVKQGDTSMYVQILPKVKLIHLCCFFEPYNKRSINEMIQFANKFNDNKRFVRVSIDPEDGSTTCDYYLPYIGGVNSENFLDAIDWLFVMQDAFEKFVIAGGEED